MPMVPGLSANMPSRVNLEEFSPSWNEPCEIDSLFESDFNLNNVDLSYMPEYILDDNFDILSLGSVKRDCLFGKPEDQCMRECGNQCEPSNCLSVKHGYSSNGTIAFPYNSTEEFLRAVDPQGALPQQLPYSPYNDHCYYQTIGYPDSEIREMNLYESDSPSDDSADEIVDVETVQDKVEPPVSKMVKKRGRKPVKKFKFSNSKPVALNSKRTTVMKRGNKVIQSGRVAKGRRRGKSSCEPSSASSSDAEENGKRSNHNNMERHRRDEQKRMLQSLRVLIPAIKSNPKTPKVTILTEAAKFITQLRNQDAHLEQMKLNEKEKLRRALRIKKELSESLITKS